MEGPLLPSLANSQPQSLCGSPESEGPLAAVPRPQVPSALLALGAVFAGLGRARQAVLEASTPPGQAFPSFPLLPLRVGKPGFPPGSPGAVAGPPASSSSSSSSLLSSSTPAPERDPAPRL